MEFAAYRRRGRSRQVGGDADDQMEFVKEHGFGHDFISVSYRLYRIHA